MSTARDIRLSPGDLALKHATTEAVRAAGGQVFVGGEVDRAQSRISDYCSTSTADFMPIDLVRRVEALGVGSVGHPHITRSLARAAGVPVSGVLLNARGMEDLGDWMSAVSREFGELAVDLAEEDLAAAVCQLKPRARGDIKRSAGDLIDKLQQLCSAIDSS